MGFIADIKKSLGLDGSGRKDKLDAAIGAAEQGIPTPGATMGNPQGSIPLNKKKKKKSGAVQPAASKIPTTLRG